MSRRHQRDLIEDHKEWIEHQYNPGYWVNKVTIFHIGAWRQVRRHNKLYGIMGMFIFGLGLAVLVLPAIDEANATGVPFFTIPLEFQSIPPLLFSGLMFLAFLYLFLQSPVKSDKLQGK